TRRRGIRARELRVESGWDAAVDGRIQPARPRVHSVVWKFRERRGGRRCAGVPAASRARRDRAPGSGLRRAETPAGGAGAVGKGRTIPDGARAVVARVKFESHRQDAKNAKKTKTIMKPQMNADQIKSNLATEDTDVHEENYTAGKSVPLWF